MKVECLSLDCPLAYFVCAGLKDVESRRRDLPAPKRIFIHAGGSYGEVRDWMLCEDLPLPLYSDFVALISDRNPGREGRYWEIGPEGKARLRAGIQLSEQESREYRFVEGLRARARAGRPLWVSQAIVGAVELVGVAQSSPSAWVDPESGPFAWVFADAMLFDEPVTGIKGRPGFFAADIPERLALRVVACGE